MLYRGQCDWEEGTKVILDFYWQHYHSGEEIYDDVGETLSESKACLNSNLIKPCLQICLRMLRTIKYDVTFVPGEFELTSMTEQISRKGLLDNRFKYYADGKIRTDADKQEPLLLEVSSALGWATQEKLFLIIPKLCLGFWPFWRLSPASIVMGHSNPLKRPKFILFMSLVIIIMFFDV